jgi:prevent-host-death family protein
MPKKSASSITSVTSSRARIELPIMLEKAAYKEERFLITRRGRPLAAVVSAEDLEFIIKARR